MIRTIVQLTDEQWVDAREHARLEGLSFAAFVRHAIDARLALAESARFTVRQRALAAIDGPDGGGPYRGGDWEGRGKTDGGIPEDDPAGGRTVPRYWLDG